MINTTHLLCLTLLLLSLLFHPTSPLPLTEKPNPNISTNQRLIFPASPTNLPFSTTGFASDRKYNFQVTFDKTFTNVPNVALGIISYQYDSTKFSGLLPVFMGLYSDFADTTTGKFLVGLRIYSMATPIYVAHMKVNYIAIDMSLTPETLTMERLLIDSSYFGGKTATFTRPASSSTSAIFLPSVIGDYFSAPNKMSASVEVTQTNAGDYKVVVTEPGSTSLNTLSIFVLAFDVSIAAENLRSIKYKSFQCFTAEAQGIFETYSVIANKGFVGLYKYYFNQGASAAVGFNIDFQNQGVLTRYPSFEYVCMNIVNLAVLVCESGYYYNKPTSQCVETCPESISLDGTFCTSCIENCYKCQNTTTCNTCISPMTYESQGNVCVCPEGTYVSDGACKPCSTFSPGCTTCSLATLCTACSTELFFIPTPNAQLLCDCQTNRSYNTSTNACDCLPHYFSSDQGVCTKCHEVCSTCNGEDRGNCTGCYEGVFRKMVGSQCVCQDEFVEMCEVSGGSCNASICYLDPGRSVGMKLENITKDPNANVLVYNIEISPHFDAFSTLDFPSLINLGLPSSSAISSYAYSNGQLSLVVSYSQNLHSLPTSLSLSLSSASPSLSLTPNLTLPYTVTPSESLIANNYTEEQYRMVQSLSIATYTLALTGAVFLLGLYSSKLIVSEMIGVIQVAYLGLFTVEFHDPLMRSLWFLRYSHGFSDILPKSKGNIPSQIYNTGVSQTVLHNLNIIILLSLIPLLISLTYYTLARTRRNNRIQNLSKSKLYLGQWFMVATLFFLYNATTSTVLFAKYATLRNWIYIFSIVQILICFTMITCNMVLYGVTDYNYFGEFKYMFKWKRVSLGWYFVYVGGRVVCGGVLGGMGVGSGVVAAGVVGGVLMGVGVVVAVMRPYADVWQSVRAAGNFVVAGVVFGLYGVVGWREQQGGVVSTVETYIPIVILALLFFVVAVALAFVIRQWILDRKIKEEYEEPVPTIEDEQKKHEEFMKKQIEESYRHGSQNLMAKKLFMAKNKKPKKRKVLEVAEGKGEREEVESVGETNTDVDEKKKLKEKGQENEGNEGVDGEKLTVEKVLQVDQMLKDGQI